MNLIPQQFVVLHRLALGCLVTNADDAQNLEAVGQSQDVVNDGVGRSSVLNISSETLRLILRPEVES